MKGVTLDLSSCAMLGVKGRFDFLLSSATEGSGGKSQRD